MKKLIKAIAVLAIAVTTTACSSVPNEPVKPRVGKITRVELMTNEKKPSLVVVLGSATLGGLLGNQFGGGSGKYWTTSIGALGGAKIANDALSEKYKSLHYTVSFPNEKSKEVLVSRDLAPTVFKGDLVVVYQNGDDFTIDAYGKYTKDRLNQLQYLLDKGKL